MKSAIGPVVLGIIAVLAILTAFLTFVEPRFNEFVFRQSLSFGELESLSNGQIITQRYQAWMDEHNAVPPDDSLEAIAFRGGLLKNPIQHRTIKLCQMTSEAQAGDIVFLSAGYTGNPRPPLAYYVQLERAEYHYRLSPDHRGIQKYPLLEAG